MTFALEALYDAIVASLASEGLTVQSAFGWKEPVFQPSGSMRLVFVPGDPSGKVGKDAPPRSGGTTPRSVAMLLEQATVYLWAVDRSLPSERAQYAAARSLYDAFRRALHASAYGTYSLDNPVWVAPSKRRVERTLGAELQLVVTVQAPTRDISPTPVTGVSSAVTATLSGESELITP